MGRRLPEAAWQLARVFNTTVVGGSPFRDAACLALISAQRRSSSSFVITGNYPQQFRGRLEPERIALEQTSLRRNVAHDLVSHVAVAFQSSLVHASQHSDICVNVVVDFDDAFAVVKPVQPYCWRVPFQEIGMASKSVSRRASSNPSPI